MSKNTLGPEKIFISWEQVITEAEKKLPPGLRYYGVPRGGCSIAALRGIPVNYPHKADKIVDDVIDSGRTRKKYKELFPNIPFVALFDKKKTKNKKWLVFPWERNDERDVEDNVVRLLEYFGENPNRAGLKDTPSRVVSAYMEMTSGYSQKPEEILKTNFPLNDVEGVSMYDQMIVSRNIPFSSLCEHHCMPFFGKISIAYIPNTTGKVVGLSKLARLVECFSKRLQVQERLTQQISDAIQNVLKPTGVGVVVRATHTCQCFRGIKKPGEMVTSALCGAVRDDPKTREEFFTLCEIGKK